MKQNLVVYLLLGCLILPVILTIQYAFAKQEKIAYITFDDGPTLNTPTIVETLEKYDAAATFFVLEERIVMYPEYIRQIIHSGSTIGLHGVSHSEAIYASPTSVLDEMNKANASLYSLCGEKTSIVRVPFGSAYRLSSTQAKNLTDNGYIIWDWNVDPRDSVGRIVPERILKNLQDGLRKCPDTPVILFHDRKSTANLLPAVLEYLTSEGYILKPISEKMTPVTQQIKK